MIGKAILSICVVGGLLVTGSARAFTFTFASAQNGVDIVTHPTGYNGTGGHFSISVGIVPGDPLSSDAIIPTRNAIFRWNQLLPTTGNVNPSGIPAGTFDLESTILHEMGHAIGLSHPNLGSDFGHSGTNTEYTRSTNGANNIFDFNAGGDGIKGTGDDVRGDDVNLNWFRKSNNNPFSIDSVVDSTTYSRHVADLPGGDTFSANGSREVASGVFSLSNTEAVLQQGFVDGETQRTLGHDDVAGIRYAMTGVDELAGTADDYTFELVYAGLTSVADILIEFNGAANPTTDTSGTFVSGTVDHVRITSATIKLPTTLNWHSNDVLVPEPASVMLLGVGMVLTMRRRSRRSA